MNKNTKKIIIVIVVVALLVAAYIYRDKIKALFAGKKKDSDSVEQKFAAATAANDTATATTVTPADTTASASPASNANGGSNSAGNGVSYSNSARTITIDGLTYGFASASQVKTMQTNLMQGLTAYATNTGNSNAKILAQAMKSAGGADGVIGQKTAAAFAFAARNLPTSVSSYKK